jgi:murein DD-endopeptidase MepM/ murein hydrolase activator NlpD
MRKSGFNFLLLKMDRAGSHIREFRVSTLWLLVFFLLVILAGASLYYGKMERYKLGVLKNRFRNTRSQNIKLEKQLDILRAKLLKSQQNMKKLKERKTAILALADLPESTGIPDGSLSQTKTGPQKHSLEDQIYSLQGLTDYYKTLITNIENDPSAMEHLPTKRPIGDKAITTALFGERKDPFTGKILMHQGVDFADKTGTPVYAAASGWIIFCGEHTGSRKAFGLTVRIDHGNNFKTMYAHLETIRAEPNSFVKKGEVIGTLGSSGRCIGPHLHYEITYKDQYVDPLNYILGSQDFPEYVQNKSAGK